MYRFEYILLFYGFPYLMFRFKQFTIHQDRTPMKVGTDGVLLGAWADSEHAHRILDIGTGTGLIALMSAQRNPSAHIDAIEIEPGACQQARENILASPWAQRIEFIPTALQNFSPGKHYDHIVCNPPFFIGSTKTPSAGRTLARHCDSLPHTELISHTARLLAPEGNFCLILPPQEARQAISEARFHHLYPSRITRVLPNPGKAPKRLLVRFSFADLPPSEDELVLELSRHVYSEAYIRLTHTFYLYM